MSNFDNSKDVGRLLLYSETFGANIDIGIILTSNQHYMKIKWIKRKRIEYLRQYIVGEMMQEGIICYAKR